MGALATLWMRIAIHGDKPEGGVLSLEPLLYKPRVHVCG